jgi:hypothetical protein
VLVRQLCFVRLPQTMFVLVHRVYSKSHAVHRPPMIPVFLCSFP